MARPLQDVTIQMRQFLSTRQRGRDAIVTTLLWALYGYLWLPLISFFVWYIGFDFAYELVLRAGGPEELVLLLLWFGIVCLVILLIVVSWSGFQYSKYTGAGERRNRAPVLDPAAERELWGIDDAQQQHMKSAQVLTVSLDDDGGLTGVS
jgi:biofilm PGA synthesis protein PgaD